MNNVFDMLDDEIKGTLKKLGYVSPLSIQTLAIPIVLQGVNTLIVAPTGSGKTEAALLPVLSLMLRDKRKNGYSEGIKTIYISPLRALNRDIVWRIEKLVEDIGFSIMVRHGDTTTLRRKKFLKKPPDIAIMTLESLNLLLTATQSQLWEKVKWIIVDEIQEFLENERGSELSLIIERLKRKSKRKIQIIGLSATLSKRSLEEAKHLLSGRSKMEIVSLAGGKKYDISIEVVNSQDDVFSDMSRKVASIIKKEKGSILIFVNTRSTAEALGKKLSDLVSKEAVRVHHGSLHRDLRESSERLFKEGKIKALVATSSMELGVDIGKVNSVIQFMSPRQVITMTQRAGRAGHKIGETSRAVIVVPNNIFEILEAGVIAFRTIKGDLEDIEAHKKPYDALEHQVAGIIIEGLTSTLEELYEIVTSAYSFESLNLDELEDVLLHMDSVRVLKYDNVKRRIKEGRRTRSYFYRVSMIPSEQNYIVIDAVSDRKIGEIGERFIEISTFGANRKTRTRLKFVLAGRLWEVLDINPEETKVYVKPLASVEGYTIPSWQGELIPVSYKVAREVCALLSLAMESPKDVKNLLKLRRIPENGIKRIVNVLEKTVSTWKEPFLSPLTPVVEDYGKHTILYVCLGSRGNLALAMLISGIMESLGVPALFDLIPYAIVFNPERPWSGEVVKNALLRAKSMEPYERVGLLIDLIKRSTAFVTRFRQVSKKMGVFDPNATITNELLKRALKAYKDSVVEREAIREMIHEKLNIKALNSFLDEMKKPIILKLKDASPIAKEVLRNPYMRGTQASIDLKAIALDKLIKAKKSRLLSREVLLLCLSCGHLTKVKVSEIPPHGIRCPKCRSLRIAPLPNTEWGREAVKIFFKYKKREKLEKYERKILKEVLSRAEIYSTYFAQGMGRLIIEALMARGVGPQRIIRIIDAYFKGGEEKFYEEILKAEEEYLANRKFWKS